MKVAVMLSFPKHEMLGKPTGFSALGSSSDSMVAYDAMETLIRDTEHSVRKCFVGRSGPKW
jgi:hypothetical protein